MTRTARTQPLADTTPSVAGVAIHDARYAKADDPHLDEGTLVGFTIRLSTPRTGRRQVWEPDLSWRDCALVQISGVNPDTRTVREWSIGLDGWLPDLAFPTAEAAVKALGKPGMVAKMRKLTAEYHAAHRAERAARLAVLRYRVASLDAAAEAGAESPYGWNADTIRADHAFLESLEEPAPVKPAPPAAAHVARRTRTRATVTP